MFSTVISLLSTGLSTKLSTTSDVSFKIRHACAEYNVCLPVEIPRIWVSFGITDFIWLCTSPHELSTVIHRNLHKFSTFLVYETRWAYKKAAVRLIRNLPRSRFSKNNSLSTLGLCPNAPPKSFPNARGSVCRIALLKTFRQKFLVFSWNIRILSLTADFYMFSATTRSIYAFCSSVSVGNGLRHAPQSTPCVLRICLMDGNSEQETSASMTLFART